MNKRWVNIFKAMANINRLKIIKMLSGGTNLSVTKIAEELEIAVKSTSKHLIILHILNFLESNGKKRHVFYGLNKNAPTNIKRAIKLFCQ